MTTSFKLTIADLRTWVHLGCGEEEKFHVQPVSINIDIFFHTPPTAMVTDNLDDTVCYLSATEAIQSLCASKRFNLIESLVYEIHQTISTALAEKARSVANLKVSLKKVSPPVPGIHGGVFAIYEAPPTL